MYRRLGGRRGVGWRAAKRGALGGEGGLLAEGGQAAEAPACIADDGGGREALAVLRGKGRRAG
eukprot:2385457-Prymnesium_polylepis.1